MLEALFLTSLLRRGDRCCKNNAFVLKVRGGKASLLALALALAVGLGSYLPAAVIVPLVLGALLVWCVECSLRRRSAKEGVAYEALVKKADRRSVLLASGLIVGESLVGVLVAIVIVFSISRGGSDAPLSIVGSFVRAMGLSPSGWA